MLSYYTCEPSHNWIKFEYCYDSWSYYSWSLYFKLFILLSTVRDCKWKKNTNICGAGLVLFLGDRDTSLESTGSGEVSFIRQVRREFANYLLFLFVSLVKYWITVISSELFIIKTFEKPKSVRKLRVHALLSFYFMFLSVRELMGRVRNVVLIKCIFGSGKPKGGRDFG
jgi:hypothetical protein